MECRLSSSPGPWSCQVSIRWEFDENDKPLDDVSEVPFGALITEKDKVELALRRAQAAVLNPSISASSFLTSSLDELKTGVRGPKESLPFSRNVVCVDLEGPELTDLSFIDLPGECFLALLLPCHPSGHIIYRYHSKCRARDCEASRRPCHLAYQGQLLNSCGFADDRSTDILEPALIFI